MSIFGRDMNIFVRQCHGNSFVSGNHGGLSHVILLINQHNHWGPAIAATFVVFVLVVVSCQSIDTRNATTFPASTAILELSSGEKN